MAPSRRGAARADGAPARSDGALLGAARVGKVCSIASVSALPAHAADVRAAAEWFVARLTASGFDAAAAHETALHPVVTAEALGADEGAPTLLIYGHFDVQVRILLSALSHAYSVHIASLAKEMCPSRKATPDLRSHFEVSSSLR